MALTLSRTLITALEDRERFAPLRRRARETALRRFDRHTVGLPAWLRLIEGGG